MGSQKKIRVYYTSKLTQHMEDYTKMQSKIYQKIMGKRLLYPKIQDIPLN